MTRAHRFITTHSTPIYFALAFVISWGGVLLVIGGPSGIPGTAAQTNPLFPWVYLAMLVGPSVAGIGMTAFVHRTAGLRQFRSRVLNWRVGARWYALALLTAPVLVMATLLALSLTSADYLPGIFATGDKTSRLWFGIAVGLGAGTFEELGWTGFAVPTLRRRYSVLATGLIVGMLWGAWHLLVIVWGVGSSVGSMPLVLFLLLDLFSFLPAFRVLMVWVYDRTGSLFVAMLMHASLTSSMLILGPVAATGRALVAYEVALAAMLWLVAGVIGAADCARPAGRSPGRRAA
jgi:membrane protease YdiL (CAAX protease family)